MRPIIRFASIKKPNRLGFIREKKFTPAEGIQVVLEKDAEAQINAIKVVTVVVRIGGGR